MTDKVKALVKFNPEGQWIKKLPLEDKNKLLVSEEPQEYILYWLGSYYAIMGKAYGIYFNLYSDNSRYVSWGGRGEPDFTVIMVIPENE